MLQEIDELDQFRIIVQQLEVCRSLILKDGEAHSRSALIFLDTRLSRYGVVEELMSDIERSK
jgi:hypothetical protein